MCIHTYWRVPASSLYEIPSVDRRALFHGLFQNGRNNAVQICAMIMDSKSLVFHGGVTKTLANVYKCLPARADSHLFCRRFRNRNGNWIRVFWCTLRSVSMRNFWNRRNRGNRGSNRCHCGMDKTNLSPNFGRPSSFFLDGHSCET